MKVSYISDLHLDFHVPFKPSQERWEQQTKDFIVNLIETTDPDDRDILCLGGDYSHYNRQTFWMLDTFSKYYNRVFTVLGNHDFYLVSNTQVGKYNHHSQNRVNELIAYASSIPNVHPLFSDKTLNYKGVTFGGNSMWYPVETFEQKTFFYNSSNDSRLIHGTNVQLEHEDSIQNYSNMMRKCMDVMISHVPIIPINSHQIYGGDSCYYTPVDELPPYVIQGHSHERAIYEKAGSKIFMNCGGYPHDKLGDFEIKHFYVEK